MDKVTCPYCEHDFELCHDDGAYYNEEGEGEEAECPKCDKCFMVYSSQSWDFEGYKADCLNDGGEHKWKKKYSKHNIEMYPEFAKKEICEDCDKERTIS